MFELGGNPGIVPGRPIPGETLPIPGIGGFPIPGMLPIPGKAAGLADDAGMPGIPGMFDGGPTGMLDGGTPGMLDGGPTGILDGGIPGAPGIEAPGKPWGLKPEGC